MKDREILEMARVGFAIQREELAGRIREIDFILAAGDQATVTAEKRVEEVFYPNETPARTHKPRKFSRAARKRMAEAQQRRWAKVRSSKHYRGEKGRR